VARRGGGGGGGGAEDYVPQLRAERFYNRHRQVLTFGADASVAAYVSFDTGMRANPGGAFKWVVVGAYAEPRIHPPIEIGAQGTHHFTAQLLYDEQTALKNADDALVIGSIHLSFQTITAVGTGFIVWPLAAPMVPTPVFASKLTWVMQAQNLAGFNSASMVFTVLYGIAPISPEEIIEIAGAKGL
jgi:hypothetical protein